MERVLLAAFWRNRRSTAREYIELCYTFLHRLKQFFPIFANRCIVIGTKSVMVPPDYSSFQQVLAEALEHKDWRYDNPNPSNKSFTLDSTLFEGFSTYFRDSDPEATDETAVSITIFAGGSGTKQGDPFNTVWIEIPAVSDFVSIGIERLKPLFSFVVEHWQPFFAVLTSLELMNALEPGHKNLFTVGTLTYFVENRVKALAKGFAAVEDGPAHGVLLTIEAPMPWSASAPVFKPCYDRLHSAEALDWNY